MKRLFTALFIFLCVLSCTKNKHEDSSLKNTPQEISADDFYGHKMDRYYANDVVEDEYGVIAPWYKEQNGQVDERVRVSVNLMKRYPWGENLETGIKGPYFAFTGVNQLSPNGDMNFPDDLVTDKTNGDIVNLASFVVGGMLKYYVYSGDVTALNIVRYSVENLLASCLIQEESKFKDLIISVPLKGKAFGRCNPEGKLQTDLVAQFGFHLIHASQALGENNWFELAKKWGDIIAREIRYDDNLDPLPRYLNSPDSTMTSGHAYVALFLQELVNYGYSGKNIEFPSAITKIKSFIKTNLLPNWATRTDAWGRTFWDVNADFQTDDGTNAMVRLLMSDKETFTNWKVDVRNLITLIINHSSTNTKSGTDTYSGAWQYPESTQCCGRSIGYGPHFQSMSWSLYAAQAQDPWAREIARRILIISSYDFHSTGYIEDSIDGGQIIADKWFKGTHPFSIFTNLSVLPFFPEYAPGRESHILDSSIPVKSIVYKKNVIKIELSSDKEGAIIGRTSFKPIKVFNKTKQKSIPFEIQSLSPSDYIIKFNHRLTTSIVISGENDTQVENSYSSFTQFGNWKEHRTSLNSSDKDSFVEAKFKGNQLRLIGRFNPRGGRAKIFIDGKEELTLLDFYSDKETEGVIFSKSGLENSEHSFRVVVMGENNGRSTGREISLKGFQSSDATYSERSNKKFDLISFNDQRVILGYPKSADFVDSEGRSWRSGSEFSIPLGNREDSVKSWWVKPIKETVTNTKDEEIYRYGVHGKDFKYNFTVVPSHRYCLRLHFVAGRKESNSLNSMTIHVNGKLLVEDLNVGKVTGGKWKPYIIEKDKISPRNGVISVRFRGGDPDSITDTNEAYVQSMELLKTCETLN